MVDFLACFTTASLGDIECLLGQGFNSIFGGPILLTLAVLLFGAFIGFKMRLSTDLFAVFMMSLVLVMVGAFVPQWIFWLLVIVAALVVAFGLYKFINR